MNNNCQLKLKANTFHTTEIRSGVGLFDVGCNIGGHFSDANHEIILSKSWNVNVLYYHLSGYDINNCNINVDLCRKFNKQHKGIISLSTCVGIHPYNVTNICDNERIINDNYCKLEQLIESNIESQESQESKENDKIVTAIGETGLDYSPHFPDKSKQLIWFEKHIQLAQKYKLPLYLHERLAFKDLTNMLNDNYHKNGGLSKNVLIHCFTGNKQELEYYVSQGYYISVSGYLCKKKLGANLRQFVNLIPLEQLMIETDTPYMHIDDKRVKKLKLLNGKENEPVVLPLIVQTLVDCYQGKYTLEHIAAQTTKNARNFFGV